MRRHFLYTVLVICFLLSPGNSIFANPTELYKQAVADMPSAKTVDSYTEAYELYKSARENIERILGDYDQSNMVIEISSSRNEIFEFSLKEFRELDGILKLRSEAEEDPHICAFLLLKEEEPVSTYFIARIAEACSETGSDRVLLHILDKVKTVSLASSKIWLLSSVARQYAFLGQKEKASAFLSEALGEQKKVYEQYYGEQGISPKTDVGDEDLENFRRRIFASNASWDALERIIEAYIDSGLYSEVFELANSFENKYRKYVAFTKIIEGYVKAGKFRKALRFLNINIPGNERKQYSLAVIARGCVEDNELDMALEITGQLNSGRKKAGLMMEIAARYFEVSQKEKALELLSRAENDVMQMEDSWYFKGKDLRDISGILADNGRLQEAKRVLSQALEIVSAERNKGISAQEVSDIAASFAALGDRDKARRVFKQAIEDADALPGSEKDRALTYITGKYAEAGFFSEAIQTLKLFDCSKTEYSEKFTEPDVPAGRSNDSIESTELVWGGFEDEAAFEIVKSYVKAGMYSEALFLAGQIEGKPYRSDAFAAIANAYLDAGQIHRSLEIVGTMNPDVQKALVLMDISEWYVINGDLDEAIKIACSIDSSDVTIKDNAFLKMVKRLVFTEKLQKCLEIAKQIESTEFKALALTDIARGFSKANLAPTATDKAILREIVFEIHPLPMLWEGVEE